LTNPDRSATNIQLEKAGWRAKQSGFTCEDSLALQAKDAFSGDGRTGAAFTCVASYPMLAGKLIGPPARHSVTWRQQAGALRSRVLNTEILGIESNCRHLVTGTISLFDIYSASRSP
jgi:hypothetical protein